MADFIASDKFDGSKEGYTFTTGDQGTGYYKDTDHMRRLTLVGAQTADSGDENLTRKQRMMKMKAEKVAQINEERVKAELKSEEKKSQVLIQEASNEEKMAMLQKRMQELEVQAAAKQAHEMKQGLEAAEGAIVEPVFSDFTVSFEQERWGMKARLSGGPVVITTVAPDGEGASKGVRLGDVIFEINGVIVEMDREAALAMIKKGGKAVVKFKRLEGQQPVMAGVGGSADTVVKGDMDAAEQARLAAMLGNAKNQDTVTYSGQKGVEATLTEKDIKATATIAFSGCIDCTYTVEAMCTKVFVQGCKNFTLNLRGKVLTSTVETYKCQGLNLNFSTKCGTLQVDLCDNVNIVFEKAEHFFETAGSATKDKNTSMIVWAGCDDLNVKVAETSATFKTCFEDMKKEYQDLVAERSQFRIRYNSEDNTFKQEQIIRLANGFFSTIKEKNEFEERQEIAMKHLAESMGITINKKAKGKKYKPNEQCPRGSGKKYKKCCNRMDGTCIKAEELF